MFQAQQATTIHPSTWISGCRAIVLGTLQDLSVTCHLSGQDHGGLNNSGYGLRLLVIQNCSGFFLPTNGSIFPGDEIWKIESMCDPIRICTLVMDIEKASKILRRGSFPCDYDVGNLLQESNLKHLSRLAVEIRSICDYISVLPDRRRMLSDESVIMRLIQTAQL